MKFTKQYTDWDKLPIVLEVEDVCIILKCSDVTVRKYLRDGKIKGGQGGNKWHIDRDSLREFVSGKTDKE